MWESVKMFCRLLSACRPVDQPSWNSLTVFPPPIKYLNYVAVNYGWEMHEISINLDSPTTNC